MTRPWKIFCGWFLALQASGVWGGNADIGASWLKIPDSAQAAGMAGAYSAVGDGLNALGENPAGLGLLEGREASFMHNLWIQGLSTEHLAYGQSLENESGGAAAIDYINFGSVDKYAVVSGTPVSAGTYSPMAANVYAGYGRKLADRLWAGATAKFLFQNLGNSTATAAADLGILYRMENRLSLALVLSDLGGSLDGATLPAQLRLGACYQADFGKKHGTGSSSVPEHSATVALDAGLPLDSLDTSSYSLGGEYWYQGMLAARLGWRFSSYGDLGGLAGLCLGAGVKYKNFELDYALTTLGDLGSCNQLSLATKF